VLCASITGLAANGGQSGFTIRSSNRGGNTGAGYHLFLGGGEGSTATTGSAGGDVRIFGADAKGTGNNKGGDVTLAGGVPTGTGVTGKIIITGLTDAANDAAAATAGVPVNGLYRNGSVMMVRIA